MNKKILYGVVCCGTVLLASCGMVPTKAPDGSLGFPDRGSAQFKEGTFVNVANLRQMGPGLTKDQVYALLGAPHFNEGVIAVKYWNYIFNFRSGQGGAVTSCQYQVVFDHGKVQQTYWKEPACADFVNEKPPMMAAPAPMPMPAPPEHKVITLGASVLFGFNKSALDDMRAEGRMRLDEIAKSLVADNDGIRAIQVNGYTDRIGSNDYNLRLSTARAQTVRAYLIEQGVDGGKIGAAGLGSASPVSSGCPAGRTPEVIACLAPDRRVTIETTSATGG